MVKSMKLIKLRLPLLSGKNNRSNLNNLAEEDQCVKKKGFDLHNLAKEQSKQVEEAPREHGKGLQVGEQASSTHFHIMHSKTHLAYITQSLRIKRPFALG